MTERTVCLAPGGGFGCVERSTFLNQRASDINLLKVKKFVVDVDCYFHLDFCSDVLFFTLDCCTVCFRTMLKGNQSGGSYDWLIT